MTKEAGKSRVREWSGESGPKIREGCRDQKEDRVSVRKNQGGGDGLEIFDPYGVLRQ